MLKFRTNINCGKCIQTVTPVLNKVPGIISWHVDINNPEKLLIIEGESVSVEDVISSLHRIGYSASHLCL